MRSFFRFTGRLNRKPFIMRYLILFVISLLLLIFLKGAEIDGNSALICLILILLILITVSQVSLIVRRSHDLNYSWPMTIFVLVICIIPVLTLIPILILSFIKGTNGINMYGADPLEIIKTNINNKFINQEE